MDGIDREAYLAYAFDLNDEERRLRADFAAWLPPTVIDCHAHANLPEHVSGMSARTRGHMLSTFPSFTLEESAHMHAELFPGVRVRSLRFPKTFRGIDHRAANAYLADKSSPDDRVALFGLPEDPAYTIAMLRSRRYSALKMYYAYLEPPATEIYQYFTPEILEEATALGVPVILHPPCVITRCMDDLRRLLRDFPRLNVVIAHLGLTKMPVPGLAEAYAELARNPLVRTDTSMVPSAEVVRMAIEAFGMERVLFGSDQPLCLIRATAYQHPALGQRLITEFPYHWVDREEHLAYRHLAEGVTHTLWSALGAIRGAVESLPAGERERAKQRIFHDNARDVFGF